MENETYNRERILRMAHDFYREKLCNTEEGYQVMDDLTALGIPELSLHRAEIGWAPAAWCSLVTHMTLNAQINPRQLVENGLALERIRGGQYFDRLRSRIVIPVWRKEALERYLVGLVGVSFSVPASILKCGAPLLVA